MRDAALTSSDPNSGTAESDQPLPLDVDDDDGDMGESSGSELLKLLLGDQAAAAAAPGEDGGGGGTRRSSITSTIIQRSAHLLANVTHAHSSRRRLTTRLTGASTLADVTEY